jgi:preprotein translocase subunit Sss1
VIHGVGTLLAGGVGYIVGSESVAYVYELVLEE